jgi:hypothetical protein
MRFLGGKNVRRPAGPPQHPGNAEVFVQFRPVNTHRHQLEAPARRGTGIPQPRIPRQQGRDPAAISERYHKLVGRKGNRDWPDIADINFQSAHAICLRGKKIIVIPGREQSERARNP